ncbi:cytochrome c [Acidovorax sp. SRB_24]|uniref:c-type cytochrome n=1 Tax=Acidovorax sp. SRB_24 TaxID=1962700 RepID=UPI00145E01B5|nr:cytochrome c [Acidovorax sp. SRB_24]NMM77706.1 cytochrome C oxidase Cbb3 [Acidovorax sp. SRB_24]
MPNEPDPRYRAQQRENAEPEERSQPMPLIVAGLVLAMVAFGVLYILMSDPFGNSALGDRRTVADLSGPAPAPPGAAVDGKQIFTANCVACHQATGKGLPGVFPPLDGSEWVHGDARTLANILLHGVEGEIEVAGTTYKGAMPAFQQLSDAELAAVASYIRSSWSNKSDPLPPELFGQERKASTRTTPFEGGAALKALAAEKPT